ncbi:MAG: tRNA 5-methoxyuridine(34)/uridine 5-oxyacetic acid(34) synthase CmoB [Planctomycetota bacterium]
MDYLLPYQALLHYEKIQAVRSEPQRQRILTDLKSYAHLEEIPMTRLIVDQPKVTLGNPAEVSEVLIAKIQQDIQQLRPWRKGPFTLFGIEIDAEWKSDLKWARVEPYLPSLEGKCIADIGCNNGYYMFRMLSHSPRMVIGFEPTLHYWEQFVFLQNFARQTSLHFERLGIEHISYFPHFFDIVFCMGILYHHPNPIELLRDIHCSLKIGGALFVECQGIPGSESVALFPSDRYAQVQNIWFVPTARCLENWLQRAGFEDIEIFRITPLTTDEQRSTNDSQGLSLKDFLNPENQNQTIEGYPAPIRIYLKAKKLKKN